MKAVSLALALLVATATAAYAGDKNSPGTGCDKWAAWCLSQRDAYMQEDAKKVAREAAKASRSSTRCVVAAVAGHSMTIAQLCAEKSRPS